MPHPATGRLTLEVQHMRIQLSLSLILLLALCSPLFENAAGDEAQVFTISGKVFGVTSEIEAKTETTPLRIIVKDEMDGEEK